MVDYQTIANKIVQCRYGHKFGIPMNETLATCPTCGDKVAFSNFGTIGGKFH